MLPRPRDTLASLVTAGVLATVTLLAGCGGASGGSGAGSDGRLRVATAFYPLQYAVEQIGGDHVHASNLTKAGVEPHDLELSPADLVTIAEADLVVYLDGFQPAVDEAVAQQAGERAFDVSAAARLVPVEEHEHTEGEHTEGEHTGGEHTEGEHAEHDHGATDPHFWLDPNRYADVVDAIADRLAETDAEHAADYRAGADRMTAKLTALDTELSAGLKPCSIRLLVTSHEAFGYLADAYGLEQVGIAGLSPDNEPQPAALAQISDLVRTEGVTTVYAETLASPAIAETVARESGARVAVLDPIEGLPSADSTEDYFSLMRANLATLREGQECR